MRRLIGLILCIVLISACSEQTASDQAVETEKTTATEYVAKPQAIAEVQVQPLELGKKAPDFHLPGVDGKFHDLKDYDHAKVLAVIFTCNHCPTAQAYEERMKQLAKDYPKEQLQLVAISPNSPIGVLYNELGYTDLNDTYEDMVIRARDAEFNFPYLYDGDDHEVSLKYGPATTPHTFIFDQDRILKYRGRLDQFEKPGSGGTAQDVRAAIDALLAGQEPELAETKAFGCSTKWAWKTEYKAKVNKEWAEKPVNLDVIDLAGLKALQSEKSEKLRLINFWATWCGPCKIEYPEFVILQRMYGERGFEFISVSTDRMEKKEEALTFLQEKNSAVRNYN